MSEATTRLNAALDGRYCIEREMDQGRLGLRSRALWTQFRDLADNYEDMNFTAPYLSTITARTLIVHGDRDQFFPVNIPVEEYEAIPHSYLWIVPNGGHVPIFGGIAGYFTATTLAFLRGDWERQ